MKELAYATALVLTILLGNLVACSMPQGPTIRTIDQTTLREYTGAYQWGSNAFVYLQMGNELIRPARRPLPAAWVARVP